MKDAIIRGLLEGSFGLLIVFSLFLLSVGMSEVGKTHPNLVLTFYLSIIVAIPVTFNILAYRRDEKLKKEQENLSDKT